MRRDAVVGLFSAALGLLYGMGALAVPKASIGSPWAPRVFPLGISAFLVALGAAVLALDLRRAAAGNKGKKPRQTDPGYVKLIAGTVALCAMYWYVFEPFGYIVSTLCFMLCLLTLVNEPKRWMSNIVITLIFTYALWGTFVHVFDITLPSFSLEAIQHLISGGN
jgi:putative tricarboxylic transport membrane protein